MIKYIDFEMCKYKKELLIGVAVFYKLVILSKFHTVTTVLFRDGEGLSINLKIGICQDSHQYVFLEFLEAPFEQIFYSFRNIKSEFLTSVLRQLPNILCNKFQKLRYC